MAYDKRITDLAAIAAAAAAKNAGTAPQLLMADITFTLADAVEDGRIILGGPEAADEITRLNAEVERLTNLANPTKLHAAIEHGDEEHRAWLREALVAYFDGRPIPADRGGSRKQALIDEMVEGLEGASTTLNILARVAEDVRMEGAPMIAERAAIIDALILKARGKDANVG